MLLPQRGEQHQVHSPGAEDEVTVKLCGGEHGGFRAL